MGMHIMVHYYCINDHATARYMTTVSVIAQLLDVAAASVRIQPQLKSESIDRGGKAQ